MPLHRRLPKRGFRHLNRHPFAIVNVDTLERVFEDGAEVTAGDIFQAGLADMAKGRVKVLGRGMLSKKLNLIVHAASPGARAKIEAAGGAVALIAGPDEKRKKAKQYAVTRAQPVEER